MNLITEDVPQPCLVGCTKNWSRSGLCEPCTWIWNMGITSSGRDWLATIITTRLFPPDVQVASGFASTKSMFSGEVYIVLFHNGDLWTI